MSFWGVQYGNFGKVRLFLLLLVVIGFKFLFVMGRSGFATPEDLLNHYITAIRQENPTQIANLLPDTHRIDKSELDRMIAHAGGKMLDQFQISYLPSESPQLMLVKLSGSYQENLERVEFSDTLYLQKIDNRWFLLLGRDKNGIPTDASHTEVK